MEFTRLTILSLLSLAFMGLDASPQLGEDLWKSIWPKSPIPETFSDLLLPYGRTDGLPIKGDELNQYSTLFFEHDLHPGKKITLGGHKNSLEMVSRKLTKPTQGITDSIWLTNKDRQSLDDFCESPTALGEHKHCVSSLETMMEYVISKFGTTNIKTISSTFSHNNDQYEVEEVRRLGDNAIMCHRLNFEKVVFNCHQVKETIAYLVSLVASDGTKIKALTVCHHDTRGMNPDLLYNALKVEPGTVPVCHFIGNKAAAWVPDHSI